MRTSALSLTGTSLCFDRSGRRAMILEPDGITVIDIAGSPATRLPYRAAQAIAGFDDLRSGRELGRIALDRDIHNIVDHALDPAGRWLVVRRDTGEIEALDLGDAVRAAPATRTIAPPPPTAVSPVLPRASSPWRTVGSRSRTQAVARGHFAHGRFHLTGSA
ncbi:MAG TPA: hypothetical protein VHT91_40185, partial [Kofleriaceae bacterium]|nr:hypothetical protein [Kofleriaceae bacterium]